MADALEKLFGSPARLKLLRLFLFNPGQPFTLAEAARRARVPARAARREVTLFFRTGVIKRLRTKRFVRNEEFPYLLPLQHLLLNTPARAEDITSRLRSAGGIRLMVLSGIFVGEWEGRLDVLLAGDRVNERKLHRVLRGLEADLGRELRYTLLPVKDFLYRLNMNDKLVRDVFDYPHRMVLDRLQIGLK